MANEKFQRQTAKKCSIQEILTGTYVVQEGWKPNYIQTPQRQLVRINIIGFVVDKPTPFQFMLDDGTGTILVSDFNQLKKTEKLKIGEPVLIIGRPRQTEDEFFIALEVLNSEQIKKTPRWITKRKEELKEIQSALLSTPTPETSSDIAIEETEDDEDEVEDQESLMKQVGEQLTGDDVVSFVRKKDTGEGCSIQDIIDYFGQEADDVILTLMSMGEVYEIKPGKIKVLE